MRARVATRDGFSLLEIAVVIVIIAILAALALPAYGKFRARAQRVRCMNNLKNLAVAANLYLNENQVWPQIPAPDPKAPSEEFAEKWIAALAPFGATRNTWICPSIQSQLRNPDYSTPGQGRIDYIATPFDDKPMSPREWPRQPWFVETGDMHGNGNLIIFTDGSINDLKTVVAESKGK